MVKDFLGKIFLSMLLYRFPEIARVYVLVRKGKAASSEARFFESIAESEPFRPIREKYGAYEAFLREKVVAIDGDVGKTFGQLLHDELGLQGDVISVDGVHLHDLDFVDVGEPIPPAGVVPIVIKSLLFHGDSHAHRHAHAHR